MNKEKKMKINKKEKKEKMNKKKYDSAGKSEV